MDTASFRPNSFARFLMLRVVYLATRSSTPTASTVPISLKKRRNAAGTVGGMEGRISTRTPPKTTPKSIPHAPESAVSPRLFALVPEGSHR